VASTLDLIVSIKEQLQTLNLELVKRERMDDPVFNDGLKEIDEKLDDLIACLDDE
jgi:hypothetical protein